MANIRKALAYTSSVRILMIIINLLSITVFSRLLTPQELGIHVLAIGIAAIGAEVRLLGTGVYIIREKELDELTVRRVLTVTLLFSSTLGLLTFFLAPVIANFFNEPLLVEPLRILSIPFFLAPFGAISASVMSRNFQFKRLMLIDLSIAALTFVITLVLILNGFSYLSLAWGVTAASFIQFILHYFLRPSLTGWIPSFSNLVEMKKIINFGAFVSLTNFSATMSDKIPEFIIGKYLQVANVAIFSRGSGYLDFINKIVFNSVKPILSPYFAEIRRNADGSQDAYINAVVMYSGLIFPLLGVAYFSAYPAVMLMFGSQWTESVKIVEILIISAVFQSVTKLASIYLVTHGHEKYNFYRQILNLITALASCYLLKDFGITGVAYAVVVYRLTDFFTISVLLKLKERVSFFELASRSLRSIYVGATCSLLTYLLDKTIDFEATNPLIVLAILSATLPVCWLLSILIFNHDLKRQVLPILFTIRQKIIK